MKALFLGLLLFGTAVGHAQEIPATDADIAKAFRLAYSGELTDGSLVHRVESRYDLVSESKDRVQTAYLLTFAPRRLLRRRVLEYVQSVLENPQSETILGKDSLLRLYRMRGDEAFEKGKFTEASHDLEKLLHSPNRLLRDYAVLKVGWCYLNLKKADPAFEFWLKAAKQGISEKANLSPNLFHGLGLAFVESGERRSAELDELLLDTSQIQQFALGIDEGIESLTKEENVESLAKALSQLRWKDSLADVLFENLRVGGSRSCRLLPLVKANFGAVSWKRDSRILEACSQYAVANRSSEKISPTLLSQIEMLLDRYELKGDARRVRFQFLNSQGNGGRACLEGVSWVVESENPAAAPVKEIAKVCAELKLPKTPEFSQIAAEFEKAAGQIGLLKAGFLKSEKDPLLYIFTATLNNPALRLQWTDRITKNPEIYRNTLAPALLAESLKTGTEPTLADPLLDGFGFQTDGTLRTESIWEDLLANRIQLALKNKQGPKALELLMTSVPLVAGSKISKANFELWLSTLNRLKTEGALKDKLATSTAVLLKGPAFDDYPNYREALLELAGEFELWPQVWERIESNVNSSERLASEKLKILFFEAVADGKFSPPLSASPAQSNNGKHNSGELASQLSFLAELGNQFHQHQYREAFKLDPKKKTPLTKDLTWLRTLEMKRSEMLGPKMEKRDRITQVTNWVQFIDKNSRGLNNRIWVSSRLYRAGADVIADFCREATGRLGKLQTVSQRKADNAEQWNAVVPLLQKKFRACQNGGNDEKS